MPVRTRNSSGRFENTATGCAGKDDTGDETPMSIPIKKTTVVNFFRILVMVLVISPWLFMALRKNTLENVSKKITSFYDDNFSCSNICLCDDQSTFANSTNSKNKIF
jgi:hypothetical protein